MNALFLFAFVSMYRVTSVPVGYVEQPILAQLATYGPCRNHSDCCEMDFCNARQTCAKCSGCHYDDDAINGECPRKCPALCMDEPPQYPKCTLCNSQDECDMMHDGGLHEEEEHMYPSCNDNSSSCNPNDQCKAASSDYKSRMEAWFQEWYQEQSSENGHQRKVLQSGEDHQMPPLRDWVSAGDDFCTCFHNQIGCVMDNQCFVPTQEDIEGIKEMPFTFHEWCSEAMKCPDDQCAWAEGIEELLFGQEGGGGRNCSGHDECGPGFCYNGICAGCEECHFDWDAIDGTCPEKCPALCQDDPPEYPKCPLCENQEQCNAMSESGFQEEEEDPWPKCTDGSDRCEIHDDCKVAMIDYAERLEAWFHGWFENHPNATEMPPLDEWVDAGSLPCECINTQATCIIDAECYSDEDIEELEELPFTLHEWCTQGMKCERNNCEWASWQAHGFCHDFLSVKVKKMQGKIHQRKIQKEMKQQHHLKKELHAVLKMQKFSASFL